jgi:3alpha(or 20beta)-hydroxysteroid dehydrogenase
MGILDGKVAIVTGAAGGMGAADSRRLVQEGARVVLTDVQEEAGNKLASQLGENALFLRHDVSSDAEWKAVVAATLKAFGRLDILNNNAAVYRTCELENLSSDDLEFHLRINLLGAWHGIRHVIQPMRNVGGGSIINKSSIAGMNGYPGGLSSYGVTKWAVRGLTKYAAVELGQYGIRVNAIHPGPVQGTGMFLQGGFAEKDVAESFLSSVPLRRFVQTSDVSDLVVFLASDASRSITGCDHVIDGGSSIP